MVEYIAYKITEGEKDRLPIKEGQLIYTTDTEKIYLDINNNQRICYNEIDERYTSAIDFTESGFDLTFKDDKNNETINKFDILIDGKNIIGFYNKTLGETIDITGLELGSGVGRFEYDEQGNIAGEIFNSYEGSIKNTAQGFGSHAEGADNVVVNSFYSHVEGQSNKILKGNSSHVEGYQNTIASVDGTQTDYSHIEGTNNTLIHGIAAHIEGQNNQIEHGNFSHASGNSNKIGEKNYSDYSYVGGSYSEVNNNYAFAHGLRVRADGIASVAFGQETLAGCYLDNDGNIQSNNSNNNFAEGLKTQSYGIASHAEGSETKAGGEYSHAEGYKTKAIGSSTHAEGSNTLANGSYSHAQNLGTIAGVDASTAIGKYNDHKGSAFEIGNGTNNDNRSNAFEVDWNGNVNIPAGAKYMINNVPIEGGSGEDKTYEHNQNIASKQWIIEHNLNKKCSIKTVDIDKQEIVGVIQYINDNKVQVDFNVAIAGYAYCN